MTKLYFRCENGHEIVSPVPIHRCPAFRHGRRCEGLLKRFGPGSRKQKVA